MSAFYPSTSSAGQLSLLPDMTTVDHRAGPHPASSVFSHGLRGAQTDHGAVDRHSDQLSTSSRTAAGFPPNFLAYSAADFRDFGASSAAGAEASKLSASASRHRRSIDESNDDFGSGLDLTGMHDLPPRPPDVFKAAPVATVDHRPPLGSPTSSSSSHRHHPDHQSPSHLHQQHQMLRSADLLQQQQQQQRQEELFMQQARQWYLQQSPTTPACTSSAIDHHVGAGDLVNGRSPGAAPPPLFRHELGDIAAAGNDPQCQWPTEPSYNGPITQRQMSEQNELSPTQKTADGVGGIPFYPWMAVVGWYTYAVISLRVK